MIDSCEVWMHNDAISREVRDLITAGYCTYGDEPCPGLWGLGVPSKWAVGDGPGSQAYVDAKTAEREVAATTDS